MALARAALELLELDEQPAEIVGRDADAGVLDLEPEQLVALGHEPDDDAAAVGRELQRVRQVVVRHLLEPRRIEKDALESGRDLELDLDLLRRRRRPRDRDDLADELADVDLLGAAVELAGLDLREIE